MIRDIVFHPDKRLRLKSKKVLIKDIVSKEMRDFLIDMGQTMLEKDGIGLAAPQIGVSKRIVVINTKDGILALINPIITKQSWRKEIDEEGCLSVPGVYANVKRPTKINVEAYDSAGQKIKFEAKGLFARVILHEVDHLNGILFIDKAIKINKKNDRKE